MTPEQKMKTIVEAAGECWHEVTNYGWGYACTCTEDHGFDHSDGGHKNPSPEDLNELFKLVKKLGYCYEVYYYGSQHCAFLSMFKGGKCYEASPESYADTLSKALLNALYEAVKPLERVKKEQP